jgi:hypothetical protein
MASWTGLVSAGQATLGPDGQVMGSARRRHPR